MSIADRVARMTIERSATSGRLHLCVDGKTIGTIERMDSDSVDVKVLLRFCDIAASPANPGGRTCPPSPPPPEPMRRS